MNKEWVLQNKETRRTFSNSTWIPLRASQNNEHGNVKNVDYTCEFFGCGSVAFPPEHREIANNLSWSDIGIGHNMEPYAYEDGYYSSIEQYQRNDREPIGFNLVFEHYQPVVGGRVWTLNPDLVVALRLIKEGSNWLRPEEDFAVVAREIVDDEGNHQLIEIKRSFLIDYLAARNLSLRLSYYRQRVENVDSLEDSLYENLEEVQEQRDDGRFELRIKTLEQIYGGSWASMRIWRTDVDEDDDAPVMGVENDDNTDYEKSSGYHGGYSGTRIEGEFWRDEWIEHQGKSIRIRGDNDDSLPQFVVETDGSRLPSENLNNEDVGRWLWFNSSIITELLNHRGFYLEWYSAKTGSIKSTSGYQIHFGLNDSDLITVYAHEIARLNGWEQHVWAAHNVVPDGKVSKELLASQVEANPASTHAVEMLLLEVMKMLEEGFKKRFNIELFSHQINEVEITQKISRFVSKDEPSLLTLAKELVRVFSDRLNKTELRKLATHEKKKELGSNKLLEDILANEIGAEKARRIFSIIAGVYDMRLGDAHPTSSKIGDALKLAGIDSSKSFLGQGEQLISNYGQSILVIGKLLFEKKKDT
jgi:hypothetical protein